MQNKKRISDNPQSIENTAVHLTVRDLPDDERPYEKCERYGPSVLSDAELLAVVIRTGTHGLRSMDLAYSILKLDERYSGIECLFHLGVRELTGIKGIGRAKAVQLVCAAELARRLNLKTSVEKRYFRDSSVSAAYFSDMMRHLEHEEVHAAYLDLKLGFIASQCIYKGTLNRSLLEPREVFMHALRWNAACFILAHNHPSGNPEPSDMDIAATKRIIECGNIMGIRLYDHIIVGNGCWVSMRDEGII